MLIHQRSWIRCASYVVLALTCLFFTDRGAEAGQTRMKVVLDTDIGTDIDDAWALGYAVKSPSFELLGVTVSDADTPQRAKLACKLLSSAGPHRRARRRRPQDSRRASRSRRLSVHLGGRLSRLRARRHAGESNCSPTSSAGTPERSR